ncbi:MAG TPA: hypothetical protein EYQ24_10960, partial [Bacteroidetes bacterium]|nr:hypothetical protein [Bacteroidota bacterium]
NVLLQVLDDGQLTDGQGRTVDFKQTLIILTSNLGAQALSQLPEGADASDAKRDVMDAVRAHFRPEFLNRLDETIVFEPLTQPELLEIVDLMASEEQARRALAMTAAMQREMARLREAWAARGMRRDLDLRIGVHHAEVTVGNFGSDELVEFTAIGRGVNLAARLESACAPGGVLVSSEVRALAPDAPFGTARQLELKGIEGTVEAFPLRLAALAERVGEA